MPCRVILVEPRDGRNIGMVARACANFGIVDLRVVHTEKFQAALDRAGRSEKKARQLGIDDVAAAEGARPSSCALDLSAWKGCERLATEEGTAVLRNARLHEHLQDALRGANRTIAFSGREGRNFRQASVELRELAVRVSAGKEVDAAQLGAGGPCTALVFGSEDVGLSTENVLMCDDVCMIRTSHCSSLNLSVAVAVVLARIHEEVAPPPLPERIGGELCVPMPPSPSVQMIAAATPGDAGAGVAGRDLPEEVSVEGAPDAAPAAVEACDDVEVEACYDADVSAAVSNSSSGVAAAGVALAPAAWTATWAELCRSKLETLGYPTQSELWHGRGRRKCKFTYRLFRIVADCSRTLGRSRLTQDESVAWGRLVEVLATPSSRLSHASDLASIQGQADVFIASGDMRATS